MYVIWSLATKNTLAKDLRKLIRDKDAYVKEEASKNLAKHKLDAKRSGKELI